jgi:hypothetical protein
MTDDITQAGIVVGRRVYWIHEDARWSYIHRCVYSGVVMSTGSAVTQVWNDNPRDPLEHHALTFANDKVWPDEAIPARIVWEKWREEHLKFMAKADSEGVQR